MEIDIEVFEGNYEKLPDREPDMHFVIDLETAYPWNGLDEYFKKEFCEKISAKICQGLCGEHPSVLGTSFLYGIRSRWLDVRNNSFYVVLRFSSSPLTQETFFFVRATLLVN